jgi:hypothetical protein
MQLLRDGVYALGDRITDMVPAKEQSRLEELEEILGSPIPMQVDIHPPNDIRSKGRIKRIKGHAVKGQQQNKNEQERRKCYSHEDAVHVRWSDCMIAELVLRKQTKDELG